MIWIFFGNVCRNCPTAKRKPGSKWVRNAIIGSTGSGGWSMFAAGIAVAAEALFLPLKPQIFLGVFFAITAALLLPYGALAAIYVRSYRRKTRRDRRRG